ncbi:MAG: hypothetical protein PVG53_04365 [Holophagae bacterium]|jgi:hypothetical protein
MDREDLKTPSTTENGWARARARLQMTAAVVLSCAVAAPAFGQVPSALIREGDALPAAGAGQVVTSLTNTATNHVGGYAVGISTSDGGSTLSHIWGNAAGGVGALLRSEATYGTFVQESFESFYGMSNTGQLAYSSIGSDPPLTSLDSVWLDDTPVIIEEQPVTALPGQYWTFGSRPSVSADGVPHWVGGISSIQGGSTENRVLASTMAGAIALQTGQTPAGLPAEIDGIDFDYRYSALSSHYIAPVTMNLSTAIDGTIVVDGAGLSLGGTLVQEGNPVPPAIGGIGGENWDNFDFTGHTEDGQWFFTGDTDGNTATDEIIVKNGLITIREGDTLDGEVLGGSIEGAYMNENGDVAFIWDVAAGTLEALYLNERLLVTEGDEVDWDGDGVVDAGYALTDFTGTSTLTISDRDGSNDVDVYFTADIAVPGAGTLEGFFRVTATSVPVELQTFTVE